ncbi:MAG TPA: tetratricopeptide repeat protein [Burkholderiaceae bacterium]|nr:tetratricopeptide repeat protein [Burkholderiaceae bacterium]
MSNSSSNRVAVRIAVVALLAWGWSWPAPAQEAAKPAESAKPPENTVRAEVGKPIQAARDLIQAKKYRDALAKVHEAEAVPNLTPYEKFAIDLTRGSAAQGAGDTDVAMSSFESVVASGRLPAADQLRVIGAIAEMRYQLKDYAKAIAWGTRYEKEGGNDPGIHQVLIQSYYLSGENANAARLLKEQIEADEKADRVPSEEKLQFLASCYVKMNDNAGYVQALEKLVAHYPKKSYWADLISRVRRKPGYSERLDLDVLRLQLATGNLSKSAEYMEMAQLALQAGFPSEAKRIMDQGYAAGLLGKGAEAERENRLRDLANKQAAQDASSLGQGDSESSSAKNGDALVAIGYNYVLNGKADRGLALMEQGLKQGPLKHPEEAKLHLGLAYVQAGQKAKAIQLLQTVHGNDGAADLARLWVLQTNRNG